MPTSVCRVSLFVKFSILLVFSLIFMFLNAGNSSAGLTCDSGLQCIGGRDTCDTDVGPGYQCYNINNCPGFPASCAGECCKSVPDTPTPTPFQCVAQYGIYFSCYAGGCPQNWVPASQNPDTSCGSSMSCCWYNPPPAPTSAPTPTTPPSCVQQPGSFAWSDCDTSRCSYSINYWYNCDGTWYPSGGGTDYGCSWTCASAPTPTTPPPGFTPPPATPTPTTSVTSSCANPPPGLVETSGGWGYTCSANYCSGSGSPADACASSVYQCLGGSWQYKWPQCGIDVNSDGSAEYPCRGCSISMPSPTPTVVPYDQPCGSCGGDCPGDSTKSLCFDGLTYSCQPNAQCYRNSSNVCTWDPTNCKGTPGGGGGTLHCTECKYGDTGLSDQPATFIENYEDPAIFGCAAKPEYFGGQSYGPGKDEIQGHIENCEWRRTTGEGCAGKWGTADYDIKYCICGDATAQWNGGGLFINPNTIYLGDTVTVEMVSYKAYDLDTGSAGSQDPHQVYLGATTPSGWRSYGHPNSTFDRPVVKDAAGWPRNYTQRVYRWVLGPSQINQAGNYNFSFYVEQQNWSCAQSSLTVSGPTPTPLPAFMQIIGGDVYSNE